MAFFKSLFGRKQPKADGPESSVRGFIHLLLFQAQRDGATELVIGGASRRNDTPMRIKVRGAWRDLPPFPSGMRSSVIAELLQIAGHSAERFPYEGMLDVPFGGSRLTWTISMATAEAECKLVRVQTRDADAP